MGVQTLGGTEVFYLDPTEPVRANRVVNPRCYRELVKAFRTGRWDGPPVVVLSRDGYDPPAAPLAITGSHRLAAADEADLEVPCVDLADLFAERGLNLDDLLDEWIPDDDRFEYNDDAMYRAIARVLNRLSMWQISHYGINLVFCSATATDDGGHRHLCALRDEHYLEDDGGLHACVVCFGSYAPEAW